MYPTIKNEGSHYLIETFHYTLKVFGLTEHQGELEGFDRLVVEDTLVFDSPSELFEALGGRTIFSEILAGLKAAAREENASWLAESKNLRQWLNSRRG